MSQIRSRTHAASLWIGGSLSYFEILSLKSMVAHGLKPHVYSYEPLDLPRGVRNLDAETIWPQADIWKNKERSSFAPFSDVFRYAMLAKTDYYWVDLDVVALRAFDFSDDYFLAWHPPVVAIGVLSLPKSSPTLAELNTLLGRKRGEMPWLRHEGGVNLDEICPLEDLPYKALGPLAMTFFLKKNNEISHVLESASHYPYQPRHILRRFRKQPQFDLQKTYSVHLYASNVKPRMRDQGMFAPPQGSLLDRLVREYEVCVDEFPLN